MDEFDKFKAATYGQESGNGSVPTDKPNYAGARGKGQILESTFKGLQAQGKIPVTYEWSNLPIMKPPLTPTWLRLGRQVGLTPVGQRPTITVAQRLSRAAGS
jgi:hypothetical protein